MKKYFILIKSHTDAPDYEDSVIADKPIEAANIFYDRLDGDYSIEDILRYMEEE